MASFKDTIKYFLFIGYLAGALPIPFFATEVLGKQFQKSKLAKLTILYSALYLTALMLLSGDCSVAFARSMENPTVSKLTGTNLTAFRILINFIVHFVVVVFNVGILHSGRMKRMVMAITEYDDQFRTMNTTRIATPSFFLLLLVYTCNVMLEAYKTYWSMSFMWNEDKSCFGIRLFPWIDFKARLVLIVVIPHILFKLGAFVILASIGILTDAVTDRINGVTKSVVRAFPMLINLPKQDPSTSPSGNNNRFHRQDQLDQCAVLESCSRRLASLTLLEKQLRRWAGLIILIVIALKIVELIAAIYLGALTIISIFYFELRDDLHVSSLTPAIVDIVILFFVAEAGQRLINAEIELRQLTHLVDMQRIRDESLREQLATFQNLVSNSRFRLSACNFFDVHRKLLASMVGPTVTFVVVLAQFRHSDGAD